MAAKARTSSRITAPALAGKPRAGSSPKLPLTLEEHVHRIEAIGKRPDGYIRFMCQIAGHYGTSGEVKERAVTAFYEQMIIVERQLGHIHDELRLE
jgi:hypothetical protein